MSESEIASSTQLRRSDIPLNMFLQKDIFIGDKKFKVLPKSKYGCEIHGLQFPKSCGSVLLEVFNDYPALKSNPWSWGDINSKELKSISRNSSRSRIGKVVSAQVLGALDAPFFWDITKSIAMSLNFRALIIPEVFGKLVPEKERVILKPKAMKDPVYFAHVPTGKAQMVRVDEIQHYFSSPRDSAEQEPFSKLHIYLSGVAHKHNIEIRKWTPQLNLHSQNLHTNEETDGFCAWHKQNKKIVGVALFSPFDKDRYPPPITKNRRLDKADPVFFLNGKNVTDKIGRGYDLQVRYAEKPIARLLLATLLTEIRKYHGRAVIVCSRECSELYEEFGFEALQANFPFRYGGGPWKTQLSQTHLIQCPIFYGKLVDSSKNLITLESVQNILS